MGATSTSSAPTTRAAAMRSACPLASSCSCVFTKVQGQTVMLSPSTSSSLHAEVTHWTDLGYAVVRSDAGEVVLERRRLLGFCVNAALTAVTGLLWLAYWIPRTRHPRVDVVTLTVTPGGDVATSAVLDRR
ncbi:hypothetical protein EDF46_3098 [Frondihabitans sp. PhB188]|nr:hypothetical protein EDF46_3098 [Frondihabitans sp. PhB188]